MNTSPIIARLEAGEKLLLDGGTGSELQRRGVDVSRRTADGGIGAWSATANVDAPDMVRAVHEDYLRVGADIITTNSFWSNRTRLARLGQADRMEEYTRVSVELAREAVDENGFDAYVAGSMAPPTGRPVPGNIGVSSDDLAGEFRDQAAVLAEAGCGPHPARVRQHRRRGDDPCECRRGDRAPGLPWTQALRRRRHDGLQGGCRRCRPRAVEGLPVAAVLDMCSPPEEITAVFPRIRQAFEGPIGAYANIGYRGDPKAPGDSSRQWHRIDVGENSPDRYAEYARGWLAEGAQIIGGCCASGPEHIAALRPLVKG